MSTKFEVLRENHIETRKGNTYWSVDDMFDFHNNRTSTYLELVASFDTKEEAVKLFEEEKKNCSSYYQDGYNGKLVLFDLIELQENEYDEDGDLIQTLGIWDSYIEPIHHTVEEIFDMNDVTDYCAVTVGNWNEPENQKNKAEDCISAYIKEHYSYLDEDDVKELTAMVMDWWYD